jgi:hypothetical protein
MVLVRVIAARSFVVATLALGAGAASADVFKCAGERGAPVYQEAPCPPGKELRNFQANPPEITVLPAPQIVGPAAGRTGTGTARPERHGPQGSKPAKPGIEATPGHKHSRRHERTEVIARLDNRT